MITDDNKKFQKVPKLLFKNFFIIIIYKKWIIKKFQKVPKILFV